MDTAKAYKSLNQTAKLTPHTKLNKGLAEEEYVTWRTYLHDFYRLIVPPIHWFDIRDLHAMRIADRYGLVYEYKIARRSGLSPRDALEDWDLPVAELLSDKVP